MTDDELDAMLRLAGDGVGHIRPPCLESLYAKNLIGGLAGYVQVLVAEVRRLRSSPPPFPPDLERMTGERFRGVLDGVETLPFNPPCVVFVPKG